MHEPCTAPAWHATQTRSKRLGTQVHCIAKGPCGLRPGGVGVGQSGTHAFPAHPSGLDHRCKRAAPHGVTAGREGCGQRSRHIKWGGSICVPLSTRGGGLPWRVAFSMLCQKSSWQPDVPSRPRRRPFLHKDSFLSSSDALASACVCISPYAGQDASLWSVYECWGGGGVLNGPEWG